MFNDVIEEEERFFVGKVSKAQVMRLPLIHEFVSRTIQRMVYGGFLAFGGIADKQGLGPKDRIGTMNTSYRKGLRRLLLSHYFPYLRHVFYPLPAIVFTPNENVLSLGSQLQKQNIAHPQLLAYFPCGNLRSNVSHFITNYSTYSLTNALNQALIGLLTNYPIGRQAQGELDKLVRTPRIGMEDAKGLVFLPAVVEEAIRRSLIVAPMDTLYQVKEDTWYKTYFVPKGSLVIFDQDNIFPPGSRLSDDEVCSQSLDRD